MSVKRRVKDAAAKYLMPKRSRELHTKSSHSSMGKCWTLSSWPPCWYGGYQQSCSVLAQPGWTLDCSHCLSLPLANFRATFNHRISYQMGRSTRLGLLYCWSYRLPRTRFIHIVYVGNKYNFLGTNVFDKKNQVILHLMLHWSCSKYCMLIPLIFFLSKYTLHALLSLSNYAFHQNELSLLSIVGIVGIIVPCAIVVGKIVLFSN
jgi:hypothetical protein